MELQALENFLDEQGVAYRLSGKSIAFKECPECGSQKWKVLLKVERDDDEKPILGKCMSGKCGQGFSSISYLIKMGIDRDAVFALHGKNPEMNLKGFLPELPNLVPQVPITKPVKEPTPEVDISGFFRFEEWPDHPVVQYSTKRGLPKELWPMVRINHDSNSVVFLCYQGRKVVGYQERFIKPFDPNMKTKTSYGFLVSEFVLEFPNPGKKILVCEGPFTAVAAFVFGYHAICTFGSAMGEKQIARIIAASEANGQPIGMAAESDKAGFKAFDRLSKHLFWKNINIFKVVSDEKDLNDALVNGKPVKELTSEGEWEPMLPSGAWSGFLS